MIDISKLIRKEIKSLEKISMKDYPKDKIRLLYGENLIGLDKNIIESLTKSITKELKFVNLYNIEKKEKLLVKLSKLLKLEKEMITLNNGIDSFLELIAQTFINPGDEVIIPVPSFFIYSTASKLMGGTIKEIPLNKDFSLDINKLLSNITEKTKLIFIANPNNPTGNILLSEKNIEYICENFNGILVLDECYSDISGKTNIHLINKFNNLIILKGFSKGYGLAGLRIGYAISNKEIIVNMNKIINNIQTFKINPISALIAIKILDKGNKNLSKFKENKKIFFQKLKQIPKIQVFPSETSFFLIDIEKTGLNSKEVKEKLEEKNIIIKDCSIYSNLGTNYILLGIPKKEDIDYVVSSLKDIFYK